MNKKEKVEMEREGSRVEKSDQESKMKYFAKKSDGFNNGDNSYTDDRKKAKDCINKWRNAPTGSPLSSSASTYHSLTESSQTKSTPRSSLSSSNSFENISFAEIVASQITEPRSQREETDGLDLSPESLELETPPSSCDSGTNSISSSVTSSSCKTNNNNSRSQYAAKDKNTSLETSCTTNTDVFDSTTKSSSEALKESGENSSEFGLSWLSDISNGVGSSTDFSYFDEISKTAELGDTCSGQKPKDFKYKELRTVCQQQNQVFKQIPPLQISWPKKTIAESAIEDEEMDDIFLRLVVCLSDVCVLKWEMASLKSLSLHSSFYFVPPQSAVLQLMDTFVTISPVDVNTQLLVSYYSQLANSVLFPPRQMLAENGHVVGHFESNRVTLSVTDDVTHSFASTMERRLSPRVSRTSQVFEISRAKSIIIGVHEKEAIAAFTLSDKQVEITEALKSDSSECVLSGMTMETSDKEFDCLEKLIPDAVIRESLVDNAFVELETDCNLELMGSLSENIGISASNNITYLEQVVVNISPNCVHDDCNKVIIGAIIPFSESLTLDHEKTDCESKLMESILTAATTTWSEQKQNDLVLSRLRLPTQSSSLGVLEKELCLNYSCEKSESTQHQKIPFLVGCSSTSESACPTLLEGDTTLKLNNDTLNLDGSTLEDSCSDLHFNNNNSRLISLAKNSSFSIMYANKSFQFVKADDAAVEEMGGISNMIQLPLHTYRSECAQDGDHGGGTSQLGETTQKKNVTIDKVEVQQCLQPSEHENEEGNVAAGHVDDPDPQLQSLRVNGLTDDCSSFVPPLPNSSTRSFCCVSTPGRSINTNRETLRNTTSRIPKLASGLSTKSGDKSKGYPTRSCINTKLRSIIPADSVRNFETATKFSANKINASSRLPKLNIAQSEIPRHGPTIVRDTSRSAMVIQRASSRDGSRLSDRSNASTKYHSISNTNASKMAASKKGNLLPTQTRPIPPSRAHAASPSVYSSGNSSARTNAKITSINNRITAKVSAPPIGSKVVGSVSPYYGGCKGIDSSCETIRGRLKGSKEAQQEMSKIFIEVLNSSSNVRDDSLSSVQLAKVLSKFEPSLLTLSLRDRQKVASKMVNTKDKKIDLKSFLSLHAK